MALVETVRGPVDLADLGFVLMHEHMVTYDATLGLQWPHLTEDGEAQVAAAVAMARNAKALGVDTFVDLTTANMDRDIERIRHVAEAADVHVIACTGLHPLLPVPFYLLAYRGRGIGIDGLADLFVHDIEVGIAGTSVKAGIIKVGTEPLMDDTTEMVLRAAARAHRRTGVPISTHTYAKNETGRVQQDVFADEGVDLSRVVIGHSGDSADLGYLEGLIARGSVIGMDRFGCDVPGHTTLSTDERIEVVRELCARGHAKAMVLSHDAFGYNELFRPDYLEKEIPDWRFDFISADVLPRLRAAGVSEQDIETMTVTNPREFFARQGAY
jgi:phosphotriesterase-related protein